MCRKTQIATKSQHANDAVFSNIKMFADRAEKCEKKIIVNREVYTALQPNWNA